MGPQITLVEAVLVDPLIEPAADSRVVRLFAPTEPTPGLTGGLKPFQLSV